MSMAMLEKVWPLPLPKDEKLLLVCIAWHINHRGIDCRLSRSLICSETGLSIATNKRTCAKLQSSNLLEVTVGRGRSLANTYRILDPPAATQNGSPADHFSEEKTAHLEQKTAQNRPFRAPVSLLLNLIVT